MRRAVVALVLLAACSAPAELAVRTTSGPAPDRTRLAVEGTVVPTTVATTIPAVREVAPRASRSATVPPRRAVPQPAPRRPVAPAVSGDTFDRLARCESGMRQDAVGGGGRYFSYFQWALSTWRAAGGTGDPRNVDYGTQKAIAMRWAQRSNPYTQWPVCWPKAVRG